MNQENITKKIKSNYKALRENLLETTEVKEIKEPIKEFLDNSLDNDSLLGLRYRKFKKEKRGETLWSDSNGYPSDGFGYIKPWIDFFEKYITQKTIKERLDKNDLWFESRTQGDELHILTGKKDDKGEKVHLVIDEVSGEIRVDNKDQAPSEILKSIEAILTTKDGQKIKTTMDFFESINEINNKNQ